MKGLQQKIQWCVENIYISGISDLNKSGVKRLNTLDHLNQYIEQHGRIVKQSYCETV